MSITVYSKTFDDGENCVGNGLSGKVFLDCGTEGYTCNSFEDAMRQAIDSGIDVTEIQYCYKYGNEQMFRKFTLNCPVV